MLRTGAHGSDRTYTYSSYGELTVRCSACSRLWWCSSRGSEDGLAFLDDVGLPAARGRVGEGRLLRVGA